MGGSRPPNQKRGTLHCILNQPIELLVQSAMSSLKYQLSILTRSRCVDTRTLLGRFVCPMMVARYCPLACPLLLRTYEKTPAAAPPSLASVTFELFCAARQALQRRSGVCNHGSYKDFSCEFYQGLILCPQFTRTGL